MYHYRERTGCCAGKQSRKDADGSPATDISSKVHQDSTLVDDQVNPLHHRSPNWTSLQCRDQQISKGHDRA